MRKWLFVILSSFLISQSSHAAYTFKNGWFVNVAEIATLSVSEHFELGAAAFEKQDWQEAACQFNIVIVNFPQSTYAQDARFFLGAAYYQMGEFDFANESLSEYLRCTNNPRYFEEAVFFKFYVAEQLRCGAKKRFFGTKQLPKWACGKELALQIYDEVIAAVPSHDIAAQSLFHKACLLWEMKDYRCAVESYQLVIKRFPKHELAPESYLMINRVFLQRANAEFQNPDILAFAQLNLKRFAHDFPGEERLCEAEEDVQNIKEIYAWGFYDTGTFYERICKPRAAAIYYFSVINNFPDTGIARLAGERLSCIDPSFNFDLYVNSQSFKETEQDRENAVKDALDETDGALDGTDEQFEISDL